MRVVIQRVTEASVTIDGKVYSEIGNGLLVLVGICAEDGDEDIDWLVKKITNLRTFDDENGVMNRSVIDVNGEILAVSQFTLMAMTKKGNRPSYIKAASPEISVPLYEKFVKQLSLELGKDVQTVVIHAGLECGIIKSRIPEMDIISVGPNMRNIHTPDEALQLESCERLFKVLCAVLSEK